MKVTTSALHPDATQTCPYGGEIRHGLGEVVRAFKSYSARRINRLRGTTGQPVWQRNYYERVVRNDRELNAIRAYIRANPQNWEEDQEYA
jgi:REP element-mobilizing transposase RayT